MKIISDKGNTNYYGTCEEKILAPELNSATPDSVVFEAYDPYIRADSNFYLVAIGEDAEKLKWTPIVKMNNCPANKNLYKPKDHANLKQVCYSFAESRQIIVTEKYDDDFEKHYLPDSQDNSKGWITKNSYMRIGMITGNNYNILSPLELTADEDYGEGPDGPNATPEGLVGLGSDNWIIFNYFGVESFGYLVIKFDSNSSNLSPILKEYGFSGC